MTQTNKLRILLIALHYGKEGSGGARRSFLWAKGLREQGHIVSVVSPYVELDHPQDILIPHPIRAIDRQESAVSNITPSLFEVLFKSRLRIWTRWPDAEITWHKLVLKTLSVSNENYDWIITTSPPESAHRIGYKLASMVGAKWCAEFRDNWFRNPHRSYLKGLRGLIENKLARQWLKHADAIIGVDKETLEEAQTFAPDAPKAEITHFSEPFEGEPESLSSGTFNLVHAGGFSLSDRRRQLQPLLDELSPMFVKRPDLHLHLFGPLSSKEIISIKAYPARITYHGWVNLEKSRAIQAGSDAVLLYTPKNHSTALPGKYSEYCCLRKPIFFFGSDTIRKKAGRRAEFFDLEDLQNFPKNMEMPEETENTVQNATKKLISLLEGSL